mmetsp:Transcript_41745/g.97755  ORF Transcript_41745/g.97755 Transcript_41745/m.97755 type:complete len:264 (-) Transcript_41745:237-1028(-)
MLTVSRSYSLVLSRSVPRSLNSSFLSSRVATSPKSNSCSRTSTFSTGKTKAPEAESFVTEASTWETVKSFPKRNPFLFQLGVATAKTSAADIMAQVVAEGKKWNEIDWKRNGIFIVFGAAYLGGFQYWIMVNKYRQWFPTMDAFGKLSLGEKLKHKAGLIDAGKMVLFDICVHMPWMYFPSYYTCKQFVFGDSWNPVDWVKTGCAQYYSNMKEDISAMVKLWGPSDCIQFALPMHIRMPFRHMVSFFWTSYVSYTRGSATEEQ